MSLSKHQLAGKLSKKTLSLHEKVKFLDFAEGNPNFGCRTLAEIFKIGKTAAAIILKEEKSIRSQHEFFREKSKKRNWPGKYTYGIRDVVLRIFIQTAQCWKRKQWQLKKFFRTVALISFVL